MTNTDKLRELRTAYGLTNQKIADMLGVKYKTVVTWFMRPDSPSYRACPDIAVIALQCLTKHKKRIKQ